MPNYAALSDMATRLIKQFGQSITFTRETSSSFDPQTGIDTVTTTTFTSYGAGFDYKKSEFSDLIVAGDVRLLVESANKPKINDLVSFNGADYRVMNVDELNPAGTVLRYECQLRK